MEVEVELLVGSSVHAVVSEANDPPLILGDEPTGNLESRNSANVVEEVRALAHDQGRAVVIVTHDPGIAAIADIRVEMLDGRIERVVEAGNGVLRES